MKKFLCIYFPFWSIDVIRRSRLGGSPPASHTNNEPAPPLLLASAEGQHAVVKRCCQKSLAAGVTLDIPLPLAQAMVPAARLATFDPLRDLRAIYRLARWATRFSPFVGIDDSLLGAFKACQLESAPPSLWGIILDISGTERLHKGTDDLARRLSQKFRRWGVTARIAIAPTIGAAWALSRYHRSPLVLFQPAAPAALLRNLPVQALRLDDDTVQALSQLGLHTIEALLRLPRETLPQRFGPQLLLRIDQALGRREETFRAVQQPLQFKARRLFDTPLMKQEQVKKVVLGLLADVLRQLQAKKRSASYFIIKLEGIDSEFRTCRLLKRLSLYSATEDFAHAASVIEPVIEHVRMAHGIYGFTVSACNTMASSEEQCRFLPEDRAVSQQSQDELLNNLIVRLGPEKVNALHFRESYVPERSFAYHPIKKGASEKQLPAVAAAILNTTRPSCILQRPEAVDAVALLPDKPPSQLRWKGKRYKIIQGRGPERIEEEWWRADVSNEVEEREYFTVQDETGRWLWIFRERREQRWFVHGIWA